MQELQNTKEIAVNSKRVKIGKIPCIPGIHLFTQCSSIVDAASWKDIDTGALLKLAPYAAVVRDGVEHRLENENACIAFLSTEELWQICLEVYSYNFGFFISGGIQSVMKPLLEARKGSGDDKPSTGI